MHRLTVHALIGHLWWLLLFCITGPSSVPQVETVSAAFNASQWQVIHYTAYLPHGINTDWKRGVLSWVKLNWSSTSLKPPIRWKTEIIGTVQCSGGKPWALDETQKNGFVSDKVKPLMTTAVLLSRCSGTHFLADDWINTYTGTIHPSTAIYTYLIQLYMKPLIYQIPRWADGFISLHLLWYNRTKPYKMCANICYPKIFWLICLLSHHQWTNLLGGNSQLANFVRKHP